MKYFKRLKNKKEFRELYEKQAKEYDFKRSNNFEGKIVDLLQRKFILSEIKKYCLSENKKLDKISILEAGCGTGRILSYFAKNNFSCYGFDTSKNMLNILKNKAKKENFKIITKMGDIEKIPFPNNSFDIVYTMHVLMHMPDHKKAIEEMYRVLKNKGILIADFPNKNSIWTKLSLLLEPKRKRTRLFTKRELSLFFKQYNYTFDGLFSYARTFYKIPILKYFVIFFEKNIKLPIFWRTQFLIVVKK